MVNSNKIKAKMCEMGITQADVAKRLNLSPPTVSQKINNIRPLTLSEAKELSVMLNIDYSEFEAYFFA